MAIKSTKFTKGIRIKPDAEALEANEGEIKIDSGDNKIKVRLNSTDKEIVTNDQTQTLENKTIDATDATGTGSVKNDATDVSFDNSTAALPGSPTNVQDAIDEIEARADSSDSHIGASGNVHGIGATADVVGTDTAGQTLSNKTIDDTNTINTKDSTFTIDDATDATKQIKFDAAGTTATSTTIQANQTADRTITIPDISDELTTNTATQTLTNKTLTSPTITTPSQLDVKQDTEANLITYAATASNGQLVFATDEKKMFQVIDGALEPVGGGGGTVIEIDQTAHGFAVGNGIYHDGANWAKALANAEATTATFVVTEVPDVNSFIAHQFGRVEITAHGLGAAGEYHYQSTTVAGASTTTEPTSGYSNPLFYIEDANFIEMFVYRPSAVNNTVSLTDLDDVIITAPAATNIVEYDGAKFTNSTVLADHLADTSTHGVGEVLGASEAQVVTNKNIDGGTASDTNKITVPSDTKANLDLLSIPEGTIVYATDLDKAYISDGTILRAVGSGAGGINYLEPTGDADAEAGEGNWAKYANTTPDAVPEVTPGGTAGITFAASASSPLRGTKSYLITKPGADEQGDGVRVPFDIDTADNSSMLTVQFDYETSVDYNDGDVRVYVSNGTDIVRVNGEDLKGTKGTHIAQFQADASITSYELILHVATDDTNSYTIKFDNVQVGPREVAKGAAMTDFTPYTPTITGFGTVVGVDFSYRRSGDSLIIEGKFSTGVATASLATISFPSSSLLIDSTSLVFGQMTRDAGASAYVKKLNILGTDGTSGFSIGNIDAASTLSPVVGLNGNQVAGTGNILYVSAVVPIKGWSSNTILSEDLGTREIVTRVGKTVAQSIPTGAETTVTWSSSDVEYDTVSALDDSNNRINILETGYYDFDATMVFVPNSGGVRHLSFAVNGTQLVQGLHRQLSSTITEYIPTSLNGIYLQKGDYVELKVFQNTAGNLDLSSAYFAVSKRANPQTILDTETVAAIYKDDSGQSIPNANSTTLTYNTKIVDTHNAFSAGTYTIPVSGLYQINAEILYQDTSAWNAGETISIQVEVNGVNQGNLAFYENGVTVTTSVLRGLSGSILISVNKGDSITIRTRHTAGLALLLYSFDTNHNRFEIYKIK